MPASIAASRKRNARFDCRFDCRFGFGNSVLAIRVVAANAFIRYYWSMTVKLEYTEDMGAEICRRVADGENLRRLSALPAFPSRDTIYNWLNSEKSFADQYARARELRADSRNEEIDEIRQKLTNGQISSDVARVAIDSLRWQAGKEKPKVYGERMTLAGDKENPLQVLALRLDAAIQEAETLQLPAVVEGEFKRVDPPVADEDAPLW